MLCLLLLYLIGFEHALLLFLRKISTVLTQGISHGMWLLAWEILLIKSVLHFAFLHLLSGSYYYDDVLIGMLRPSIVAYRNSLLNRWNIVHGGKILTIIIILRLVLRKTTQFRIMIYFGWNNELHILISCNVKLFQTGSSLKNKNGIILKIFGYTDNLLWW